MSAQETQVTPQEVFELTKQHVSQFTEITMTWEELGSEQQALFVDMAKKINEMREESARLDAREAELNRRYEALMQEQQTKEG